MGAGLLLAACSSSGLPTASRTPTRSPTVTSPATLNQKPTTIPHLAIPICGSLSGRDVSGIPRCDLSSHIVPVERTMCRNGSAIYLIRSPYVDLAFYAIGHHGLLEMPANNYGPYTRAYVHCTGTHFPKK